jgi:hypothetical protein
MFKNKVSLRVNEIIKSQTGHNITFTLQNMILAVQEKSVDISVIKDKIGILF